MPAVCSERSGTGGGSRRWAEAAEPNSAATKEVLVPLVDPTAVNLMGQYFGAFQSLVGNMIGNFFAGEEHSVPSPQGHGFKETGQ